MHRRGTILGCDRFLSTILLPNLELEMRVEYFNVFTHPMFASPENLWGAGNATRLPFFRQGVLGGDAERRLGRWGCWAGKPPCTRPAPALRAQFSLKLAL